jgi:glycosyltransferase involved in cell wall biosynthesis
MYNVAPFIRRCLTSLQNQTWEDFQVIVIDDGSTDESPTIAKEFCNSDPRFALYCQKNSGQSAARNFGFSLADRDFTMFLDSDDWLDESALAGLVETAQKESADLVQCRLYYTSSDAPRQEARPIILQRATGRKSFFVVNSSPCNKLFRSEFLRKAGLCFPKIFHEDEGEIYRLLIYNPKVVDIGNAYYFYWKHPGSTTGIRVNSRSLDYFKVLDIWRRLELEHPQLSQEFQFLQWRLLNKCVSVWSDITEDWARTGLEQALAQQKNLQSVAEENAYVFLLTQGDRERELALESLRSSKTYRLGRVLVRLATLGRG